jgi:hypothetical protein
MTDGDAFPMTLPVEGRAISGLLPTQVVNPTL